MKFIPNSEKWLFCGDNFAKLERALEWAEKNEPKDKFDQIIKKIKKKSKFVNKLKMRNNEFPT